MQQTNKFLDDLLTNLVDSGIKREEAIKLISQDKYLKVSHIADQLTITLKQQNERLEKLNKAFLESRIDYYREKEGIPEFHQKNMWKGYNPDYEDDPIKYGYETR